jgi:hypothetical protein
MKEDEIYGGENERRVWSEGANGREDIKMLRQVLDNLWLFL